MTTRRLILIALAGGFLLAFAVLAAMWAFPAYIPAWVIMASDGLLLFPLILMTRSADPTLLTWLAPLLLGVEFSIVFAAVLLIMRWLIRASRSSKAPVPSD
jgi:hypothetical protein